MRKFRTPGHVPCTPKSWRGTLSNGEAFKIAWPCSEPFGGFYSRVVKFHNDNGLAVPSVEVVMDAMCTQMADHWCVGEEVYIAPAPVVKPCPGCGRRW